MYKQGAEYEKINCKIKDVPFNTEILFYTRHGFNPNFCICITV